jgi:hypothetical protein
MRLPMPPNRLAALGAVGATGGLVLLYLLFVWLGIRHPETGGMDATHGIVMWISLGVLFLALIALHLAMAHQLWHAPAVVPTLSRTTTVATTTTATTGGTTATTTVRR